MKKITLNEDMFYTPQYDYEKLKTRRRQFATNRINWFMNYSPRQDYEFPEDNPQDYRGKVCYEYYINEEKENEIRKLFEGRRSTLLNFLSGGWNKEELFKLLTLAVGPNPRTRRYRGKDLILRNYPSGGALFPVKLYVFVKNVENLGSGVYYLSPQLKKLYQLSDEEIDWNRLFPMTLYQFDVFSNSSEKICFSVFMIVDFKESFKKYGELAERLAFFEAGHVAQNLQLVSSYLKKTSLPVCGLFPEEIERQIGIDEDDDQYCVYGVVFG